MMILCVSECYVDDETISNYVMNNQYANKNIPVFKLAQMRITKPKGTREVYNTASLPLLRLNKYIIPTLLIKVVHPPTSGIPVRNGPTVKRGV